MPLTDRTVRNAKGKAKPYKLSDGNGLYLLVKTDGARYWRMDFRFVGKRGTLAFGVYPTVSLAEAREKRDGARKQIASGVNPAAKRKLDKVAATIGAANTFRTVAEEWLSKRGALTAPVEKHRPAITEPRAIGALLRAIDGFEGQPTTKAALQLAALTFARPGETRHAEWSEFDLDTAEWRIPAAKMKMRRPRRIP